VPPHKGTNQPTWVYPCSMRDPWTDSVLFSPIYDKQLSMTMISAIDLPSTPPLTISEHNPAAMARLKCPQQACNHLPRCLQRAALNQTCMTLRQSRLWTHASTWTTRHLAPTLGCRSTDRCTKSSHRTTQLSSTRPIHHRQRAAATVCNPTSNRMRRQRHKHNQGGDADPSLRNQGLRERYIWRKIARLQVNAGVNRKGSKKSLWKKLETCNDGTRYSKLKLRFYKIVCEL
jgi:hypothetical protein